MSSRPEVNMGRVLKEPSVSARCCVSRFLGTTLSTPLLLLLSVEGSHSHSVNWLGLGSNDIVCLETQDNVDSVHGPWFANLTS